MNRKQRRAAQFPKGKQKPKVAQFPKISNNNSQEILDSLEPAELVAGVNKLLSQLKEAGVEIYDWDHKERKLFKVQRIKGKFYFLAEDEAPPGDQD